MRSPYARFALSRTAQAILVVLLAYVFTFLVISVLPGDPVTSTLKNPDNGFTQDDIDAIVAYYGLDQPVWVQLWTSLSRFVVGDFGISLRSNLPVSDLIAQALPSTLVLASSALAVAIVLAALIAWGTQVLPVRYGQGLLRALPSLFLSVPNFVIGLLLIQLFAFGLGVFRIIDSEGPWSTFFAAVALGIPVSAQLAEVLIANLDHESRQEYIAVARSHGLRRTAIFARHLVKPSSLPTVTVLALIVGELLGGSLITESIFGRAGVGSLVQSAVASQDLPVLQAVVSLAAIVFVVVNLLADLAYPLLDPRVSLDRALRGRAVSPAADQPLHTPLQEEVSVV
ncbi:ABC transporter permease [Microbacterium sp.]|uniref:ABC transporter permease n=1 Tax=Microbacterium sp. TaxID=51671 RepID=UPI003C74085C